MATRTKITVSLDKGIVEELNMISEQQKTPRSRMIEDALKLWMRAKLDHELEEGYRSMSDRDRATAEENLLTARKGWN